MTETTIPRIAGQPIPLDRLIRTELERMLKAGVHPERADEWLRRAVTECSRNACELVRWQGPK